MIGGGIEAGTQSCQEEISEASVVHYEERRLCRHISPAAYCAEGVGSRTGPLYGLNSEALCG